MSGIVLDSFGNPIKSARTFVNAASNTGDRPYLEKRVKDIDELIPQNDRETLISVSRKLFANMGLARGAIFQKAMFSVGRGWDCVFTGQDKDWGLMVADLLNNQWYKTCDVRGQMFDFKTLLYLDSVAIDRCGDFAILFTESENGWPLMQRIPAHRIGNRRGMGNEVYAGPLRGYRMRDGVIKNDFGRPIAYHILGDNANEDRIVSAQDLILCFDPEWHQQDRGLPAFSHCLNEMRDMLQSQEWEQMVMLMLSAIGLIEYNDTGEPEDDDESSLLKDTNGNVVEGQVRANTFFGGMVRHFKADSGNRLETIKNDRPGDMWDRFHNRLTRSALIGINWPYSMVWEATGQGTAERADLERAAVSVEDRQDVLRGYALRIINRTVAKLIKSERIPMPRNPSDWYAWKFTMPPKISINFKNDTKALLDLNSRGLVNDTDIAGFYGKTLEAHYKERAYEVAMRKRITREVSEETKEIIEDREMRMMTPNDQPEEENQNNTTNEND